MIFFVLVNFALIHEAAAQKTEINNVRLAMSSGNSKSLTQFFDGIVELKTDNEEGSYSRNQAEFVLRNFFRRNPPEGFEYLHIGSSPGGSRYTIGSYHCKDTTYRVYMKLKVSDDKYIVDTIEFTKD